MSQIIMELNDSIMLNDSIIKKLTESADICLVNLNKTATNCCDVDIAKYVSRTVILGAAICAACYVIAKLIACIHASRLEKKKREWDKEDRLCKQESEAWAMKLQWLKDKQKDDYVSKIDEYISEIKASPKSNDMKKQD